MGSTSPLDMKHVEKKLQSLSNTRESIQSLSMWALSHKAQHEQIVAIWFQVLKTAKIELRLCLFYLCNDIVQTCRREHALVFKDAFKEVLKDAALLVRDASVRSNVKRIFKIWLERKVYDEAFVKELLATLYNTKVKSSLNSKLLAGFHPENLKKSISEMIEMEEKIEQEHAELPDNIHSKEEVEAFKQGMKNRSQGEEIVRELEKMRSRYREFVSSLEEERYQRKDLILMLELSELFYDAQMGECNILSTAYKAYSTKLNNVKRRLWDLVHPENREMDQQKKKKKNKTKFFDEESKAESSSVNSNSSLLHLNQGAQISDSLDILPAPPLEKRSNVTIARPDEMEPQAIFQKFHADQQSNHQQDGSNFYQPQVTHQQDLHQHIPNQQVQQLAKPYPLLSVKPALTLADDCYEMNHYEIGGEECTPVFDEEALEGGDGTPVQDEDPSDGYFPTKDHNNGSYLESATSKESSISKTGVFMGVTLNPPSGNSNSLASLNPHVPFPLGCLPPDLTRPPPPLNIFFSPSAAGMIRNANSNVSDKEKSLSDATHGQGIHPQVVPMPSGMFPIVGLPMSSSISSPTLPQFGMIPYAAGTIITTQQKQSAQTPPNFSHLLPNMGQVSLVSQLNVPPPGLPFQQQMMSSPLVAAPLQTVQLQNSQQQPPHLNLPNFSGLMKNISQPKPLLISDDQKSLDFSIKHSPSSMPIMLRSTSANETHYQSSAVTNKEYCSQSRVLTRGSDLFSEDNSVDSKGSRFRVNQNNLTQVKTIEDMHASLYNNLGT